MTRAVMTIPRSSLLAADPESAGGGMVKRSAAMLACGEEHGPRHDMPAPSAWVCHPVRFPFAWFCRACLLMVLLGALPVAAQDTAPPVQEAGRKPIEVGIEEHLDRVLALDSYTFIDEDGKPIVLKELFDRPVVLTLVYFRCPGICAPLLQELCRNVNNCRLTPGQEYRLITISFDPTETHDLARVKKENHLKILDKKQVEPGAWRWLTGDEENIKRITEAVGFHYIKDANQVDYVHAATVIFLSPEGKIVRYLNGLQFNPADLELAVADATVGRSRSLIQRVQALCYSYDPVSRGYVVRFNRVVLSVTVLFVLGFGGFVLLRKGKRRPKPGPPEGDTP